MISILLAVYNGENYLKEAIDSVLNQTFKDFELLIGFNGTIDNSKDIVNQYNDPRIRIFDYSNDKGKAKTLNKLLKEAKGDWLANQDDDDIWLPNKLEKQIQYTINFDVIGTFIQYINEKNEIIGSPSLDIDHENIKKLSLNGNNQIANTSSIFKKEKVLEINGWRENIEGIEDFDLWLRLIKNNNRFYNIPEYLTLHRIHDRSNFNTQTYDIKEIL